MSLINLSICLSDLPKENIKVGKNGKKYINLVCANRKEVSQYGETHVVYVSQTKEEREAKKETQFCGVGKEYIPKSSSENIDDMPVSDNNDDLPF